MKTALAAVGAVALSMALGVTALAASPEPGTLGLRLTPAPLHVDDGARTITATNLSGGLPLTVALVTSEGYAVEPATFTLAPDASLAVAVTAVDPSQDGTLSATGTADVAGAVRSAVNLSTRFVHATLLERIAAQYGPLVPLLALAAVLVALVALWAVWRRLRA